MRKITSNHHVVVPAVTAALVMSAGMIGCAASSDAASADAAQPIPVTIAEVAVTDIASPFEAGGAVQLLRRGPGWALVRAGALEGWVSTDAIAVISG